MNLKVASIVLSSCVAAMLVAAPAKADTVMGSVWANGATTTVPAAGSSIYSTTPTAVVSISNSNSQAIINFFSSTDTSLTGFLTTSAAAGHPSNGDTVTYLSGANQSNINNDLFQFTGTTTLATGTYTTSHDDGLILYLNGSAVINDPGLTAAVDTPFTVCASGCNATPGTYSFVLDYAELNGAPAQLTATLPLTSPTPEPSSFILLGSGLLGVAGMLRRRMKV